MTPILLHLLRAPRPLKSTIVAILDSFMIVAALVAALYLSQANTTFDYLFGAVLFGTVLLVTLAFYVQ